MDQDAVETLLFGATKLRESQVDAGYEIHEQSREHFGELLTAHMLAVGVIGTAVDRDREGSEIRNDVQKQIALITSFIRGINIVDYSISEGYYIQAIALIRQELETIVAIEELNKGNTVTSETSNVVHVPWSLAKLYGDLSNVDHTAIHNMLEDILAPDSTDLQEDTGGLLMVQKYNEQRSWRLFGLHVSLLILLAIHLHEYYEASHGEGQGLNEIELQALINAQKILLDCGWLTQ